jgi:hypothetical protein
MRHRFRWGNRGIQVTPIEPRSRVFGLGRCVWGLLGLPHEHRVARITIRHLEYPTCPAILLYSSVGSRLHRDCGRRAEDSIEFEGAAACADMLRLNPTLTSVDLTGK